MADVNLSHVYTRYHRYEDGRVMQTGNGRTQCGVAISKAQEGDQGMWVCKISTLDKYDHAKMTTATIDVNVEGSFILRFPFCFWYSKL